MRNMEILSISDINKKIRANNAIMLQNYEGTALSAYIPKIINGKLYELSFVYNMSPSGKGYLMTDRPYAWLAVSPNSGEILFYNDCTYIDFISTCDYPLDGTISLKLREKLTVDEFLKLDEEFIITYEELRKFVFKENSILDKTEKELIQKYKNLFNKLISEDLVPYYKALSPAFFTWLNY